MVDIKIVDDKYVISGPKCLLVLTKDQFIQALKAGKLFKRLQRFQCEKDGEGFSGQLDGCAEK
jgi:hypothetical protein